MGFVTHGGLMGIQDAVTARVPFVGIPIFGEQFRNVKNCVDRGVAVSLNYKDLTADSFVEAVNVIVQHPIYKWVNKLEISFPSRWNCCIFSRISLQNEHDCIIEGICGSSSGPSRYPHLLDRVRPQVWNQFVEITSGQFVVVAISLVGHLRKLNIDSFINDIYRKTTCKNIRSTVEARWHYATDDQKESLTFWRLIGCFQLRFSSFIDTKMLFFFAS